MVREKPGSARKGAARERRLPPSAGLRRVPGVSTLREVRLPDPVRTGDFEDFYRATGQRLVRHVYALTGDMGDAQDIAQEAYARAWQHWSRISKYDAPESWVRTVATRMAVSRWRRAQRAHLAWSRHGPPPDLPEPPPDIVLLVAALRRLPARQRTAIVLRYLTDLTVEQVAREMQCPAGTVKSWLARGRKALADELTQADGMPAPTTLRNEMS